MQQEFNIEAQRGGQAEASHQHRLETTTGRLESTSERAGQGNPYDSHPRAGKRPSCHSTCQQYQDLPESAPQAPEPELQLWPRARWLPVARRLLVRALPLWGGAWSQPRALQPPQARAQAPEALRQWAQRRLCRGGWLAAWRSPVRLQQQSRASANTVTVLTQFGNSADPLATSFDWKSDHINDSSASLCRTAAFSICVRLNVSEIR